MFRPDRLLFLSFVIILRFNVFVSDAGEQQIELFVITAYLDAGMLAIILPAQRRAAGRFLPPFLSVLSHCRAFPVNNVSFHIHGGHGDKGENAA